MAQMVATIAKVRTMRASRRRMARVTEPAGATVIDDAPREVRAERTQIGNARVEALSTRRSPGPSSPQHLHQGEDEHPGGGAVRARASAAGRRPRVRIDLDHHEAVVLTRRPEIP